VCYHDLVRSLQLFHRLDSDLQVVLLNNFHFLKINDFYDAILVAYQSLRRVFEADYMVDST